MRSALSACPTSTSSAERAEACRADRIDPIADVKNDRIYLFSGTNDHTVVPAIVAAARFYEDLGVPEANRSSTSRTSLPDTRSSPTRTAPPANTPASPTSSIATTIRPARPEADLRRPRARAAQILPARSRCSTSARSRRRRQHGLERRGLVYVPHACEGRNRLPRAHRLPRLRPEPHGRRRRLRPESGLRPLGRHQQPYRAVPADGDDAVNPQGCWDWWGYTGADT